MSDEAGEMYVDAITGLPRRKRGHRRSVRRGPYSLEEKQMIHAWGRLLVAERAMDGELAQYTCRDLTVLFTRLKKLCEQYSWENYPDVSGIDPHVIVNALDLEAAEPLPEPDVDIYRGLT